MSRLVRRCAVAALVAAAWVGQASAMPVSARSDAPLGAASPAAPAAPAGAPLPDPGALGPQAFDELSYDLGAQAFKPSGFPARVEVRAKVYAPQVIAGRAPVVIVAHGRHATCANSQTQLLVWPCPAGIPEIASYRGYDALGRNLASHGTIVVSIGTNGVNANDDFVDDGGANARGQLILEHLRRWKAWDAGADGSPFGARFVGHLDLDRVGLMGHSRGGEGIAAAVELNQRSAAGYGIKAALALAPVDFGRRIIGGVELGVVLPSCDGDVSDLQGASYYDDGRYATPGDTTSKMTALLYGANHNYFNTVWTTGPGSSDDATYLGGGPSDPCSASGPGRLTAAQQTQAGTALMAGFLRRTLDPEPQLQRFVTGTAPYPPSAGPARWSIAYHAPDRLDVETWASADTYRRNLADQLTEVKGLGTGLVCNPRQGRGFGSPDGVHIVSTPCPYAQDNAVVNDTGVLDAGWARSGPVVRLPMAPDGVDLSGYDGLRMRVAVPNDSRNTARAQQDFSVVLEDFDGARTAVSASTGTNGLQRLNPGLSQHALLNGLRLPLSAFATIDLTRVKAVELRFDRTAAGRLSIADVAFTQEGTGSVDATSPGAAPVAPATPTCRRTAALRWACAVGQVAWGRDPTAAEATTLATGYFTAASRQQTIARALGGPTAAGLHHAQYLQTFTQDEVDAAWVNSVLSSGGKRYWEQAVIDLTAAFSRTTPSLATPTDTVRAAYESIVGRAPDASGLAYWTPRVRTGAIRTLATSLVATSSHRGRVVDERYLQVVGRAPDPGGRAYWITRLARPGGEQALVASLLATEGFRAAVTQ